MKVAIVTVDGKTVSQHFGRSPYFRVLTIENGSVVRDEMRERGTGHFANGNQTHTESHSHRGQMGHGYGADADAKHASMAAEISDCDILVAGGMGRGAYESFSRAGLNVILTDRASIDDVLTGIIDGSLKNYAQSRTD